MPNRERWPRYLLVVLVPLAALCAYGTLRWPGQTFPGFLLMQNAVVPTVSLRTWTGQIQGLPYHARITTVDGRKVTGSRPVYDHVGRLPPGAVVEYAFVKSGATRTLRIPSMPFTWGDYWLVIAVMLVFGGAAIAAGLVVSIVQPAHPAAPAFGLMTAIVGLFGTTGPTLYDPDFAWLSPVHFFAQAVLPATFVHFSFVFPRPRISAGALRWVLGAVYSASAALYGWICWGFYQIPPTLTALYPTYAYTGAAIATIFVMHLEAYWHYRGQPEQRQMRAILIPMTLGLASAGYGFLNTARSGGDFPINYVALIPALYFLSIGYAIVRHGLFDVHIVVRRLEALTAELDAQVQEKTAALRRSNAELSAAYEQLKATQAQLVHSEKLASLGQLVAGVAHEINNPVSFIAANVENLRATIADLRARLAAAGDPELERQLGRLDRMSDIIEQGAARTTGIVADLRAFSRIDRPQATDVDVRDGLEVSLRLLQPKLADRIVVDRTFEPVPCVRAVPGQVNQVFMNVLANACDAIRGRGHIWVGTRRNGDQVEITIRDDGVGIAPEHLASVFDPFFTTKPQGEGTGLGMSIAHGIVKSHGGTIDVASAPGRGTTVTVRLPIKGSPTP